MQQTKSETVTLTRLLQEINENVIELNRKADELIDKNDSSKGDARGRSIHFLRYPEPRTRTAESFLQAKPKNKNASWLEKLL